MKLHSSTTQILLLFSFFIVSNIAFAQENFMKGAIVLQNGDTIRGFIDYKNWVHNPEHIAFKESEQSKIEIKSPLQIKTFIVADEIYESAIITTETSSTQLDYLDSNGTLNFQTDTTFLQTLIKGSKSLYHYINKGGNHQFYIKKGDTFELLIYKKYFSDPENTTITSENKRYIGQLYQYFDLNALFKRKIEDTDYSQQSMMELFNYYLSKTGNTVMFKKSKDSFTHRFGITVGASNTTLDFKGVGFEYLFNTYYGSSNNVAAGLFWEATLPRLNRKFSFYNEFLLTSYELKGRNSNVNNYTVSNLTHGFTYLNLNSLIRYKYHLRNWSAFANVGFSNGIAIKVINQNIEESTFYGPKTVSNIKAIETIRKYEQGYIIGIGAQHKRMSAELRYESANGMSVYTGLSSITHRIFFNLGYSF
jgi:hypothetical protein